MLHSAKLYLFVGITLTVIFYTIFANMSGENFVSVDFEVFGKVQGVFFRKHTEKEAILLGLRGWCMNTMHNTVKGVMEGKPESVEVMKTWLKETGSPASRIDKAIFSNEKKIPKFTYTGFRIKK